MDGSRDKKALLDDLRIARDRPAAARRRPLKWFVAVAVIAGLLFVGWEYGARRLARAEVAVQTATARPVVAAPVGDSVLDATGYVVARRQATVSSKTTGKVLEVLIEEGMAVREGQTLAVLDDSIPRAQLALAESQLEAARASLDEIRVNIRQAELDVERVDELAARDLASRADRDRNRLALEAFVARLSRGERDIEVAERSLAVQRRMLADFEIRAPFSGVVIAKAAQPGEMISPVSAGGGFTRTGICTIVDMDSLEVEVDVNEEYITRVFPKQPAVARLNAYDDLDIPAEVIATIPAADRGKATVRVRIGFLRRDPRILPDMGVKVAFLEKPRAAADADAPAPPSGVLVPTTAVFKQDGVGHVWVVENGGAMRREVQVAETRRGNTRIASGLAAGERVVRALTETQRAALRDGAEVRVTP